MITPGQWMPEVLGRLREVFGTRLLYLGLQGSYGRGEAVEDSDVDVVVLLDSVGLDDLDLYRDVVRVMPEGDRACGFICGAGDFLHWPRHELFPFRMDTGDYFGKLDDFLPEVDRGDIVENARIGASGLYHMLTHSYLYAEPDAREDILAGAYKSAFFVMRVVEYLRSGVWHLKKGELVRHVRGDEREIVAAGMYFPGWLSEHTERRAYSLLRDWSMGVLALEL